MQLAQNLLDNMPSDWEGISCNVTSQKRQLSFGIAPTPCPIDQWDFHTNDPTVAALIEAILSPLPFRGAVARRAV